MSARLTSEGLHIYDGVNTLIGQFATSGEHHIKDNLTVNDGDFYLHTTDGSVANFYMRSGNGADQDTGKVLMITLDNANKMEMKDGALVIDSNDDVGIGTDAPEAILNVIPSGSINTGDLTQAGVLVGNLSADFALGID